MYKILYKKKLYLHKTGLQFTTRLRDGYGTVTSRSATERTPRLFGSGAQGSRDRIIKKLRDKTSLTKFSAKIMQNPF